MTEITTNSFLIINTLNSPAFYGCYVMTLKLALTQNYAGLRKILWRVEPFLGNGEVNMFRGNGYACNNRGTFEMIFLIRSVQRGYKEEN
jgi:hypothetical protein